MNSLRKSIEELFGRELSGDEREQARAVAVELLDALEAGAARAAEPDGSGGWRVNVWVKQGIQLAFRLGNQIDFSINQNFQFRDYDLLGPQNWLAKNPTLRVVPGGTMIRRGAFLGKNVVLVPPSYVNVGAYVGDGAMIDSNTLVGSCAQLGSRVHLGAGAQLGGVLEPAGALPVIVEDDAFIGGMCGIFEGVRVGHGALIAAGVILTGSTPVYDCVNEKILAATPDTPLTIPPNAVVIPGTRPAKGTFAEKHGLNYQTPLIVKYRHLK